ncbi:MAG TPA: imidazolonepropionase [Bryobacteraceae bacterium]|nr:imidazolonepropionase [Bryobacteraceae bacterium]
MTLAGPARPRVRAEMRELGVIRDGVMIVRDGVITYAGPARGVDSNIDVIDAGNRVVMPGFVDAHTHPVFAGNRADEFEKRSSGVTYKEISAAGGGIRSTVRKTRAASEDELFCAASRYAQWFLRGGTTTIEAKSGYGLMLEDELKMLRVIHRLGPLRTVPTFLGAHEIPDEYRSNRQEYIRLVIDEMLPAAKKLAGYCDIFVEPHVFPIDDARRILLAAKGHGFKLRMHVDQLENSGGAQLAAELDAVTADHLEHTGAAGIDAMAAKNVQPVLLPGSVYALGSKRYPDARAMIEAGLAVVLATDFNPGSSPTPSMPMILSLASTQMKMTPAEAITAATINAAYSLELGAEIGSLEPGKRADFVIHDCTDYRELAYFFGVQSAKAVYIGGVPC